MRSVPTTSLDLTSAEVVADPYPFFAEERARHEVAWHEPTQMYLTFSHATVSTVQRTRTLGRLWHDKEPADHLAPFNLLHRNQMMENEPPEHTRLRRPVASAFARGHVERLRPRVRELAHRLLDEVDDDFDLIEAYAEPLPVLVIAELLGVPASHAPCAARLVAGDRADVRAGPVAGRRRRRRVGRHRLRRPGAGADRRAAAAARRRPDQRPGRDRPDRGRAGRSRRAAAQRGARGVGQRVRQRRGRDAATRAAARRRRGAHRRGDAAVRLGPPALRADRHRAGAGGRRRGRAGTARSPRCSVPPTATRRSSSGRTRSTSTATPTRTWRSASASTSVSAPRWRGWSWSSRSVRCSTGSPGWRLAGEPESRGTFVLRGFRRVPVSGTGR